MTSLDTKLTKLRTVINENIRTQLSSKDVEYISSGHTLTDIQSKQSHCIFARRGCGKTLLLHHSTKSLNERVKSIYINCEDFKHHSFPNVLIEIVGSVFVELEKNITAWFGRKKRLKEIISELRKDLDRLKIQPDSTTVTVTDSKKEKTDMKSSAGVGIKLTAESTTFGWGEEDNYSKQQDVEKKYEKNENKLLDLNHNLPSYKSKIKEFFEVSKKIDSVFIQLDDFYQLTRVDQPFVADYVHRLCKDTPLKFKIATLKHNSILYIERNKQPIGIQERHDYQPLNIDFNFEDFEKTRNQNKGIFHEYAKLAGMTVAEFDSLFKGEGFDRLILAGGGVPRDCLSFFLEVLEKVRSNGSDGKIGKDDVRYLSRQTFERRIDELKQDSDGQDQGNLLRGIHAIREFCLSKKTNVFLIEDTEMQRNDDFKTLIYRLMDYRIVHNVANSSTHKSHKGLNFQAYAIDVGCYAYMRNLDGKLSEINLLDADVKEKMRSVPILELKVFKDIWDESKEISAETALQNQEQV